MIGNWEHNYITKQNKRINFKLLKTESYNQKGTDMIIKMIETTTGAPFGIDVFKYEKGNIYSEKSVPPISEKLGNVFIDIGKAIRYENVEIPKKTETMMPPETQEEETPEKKEKPKKRKNKKQ